MSKQSIADLEQREDFIRRHIGPSEADIAAMLRVVGASSLDNLTEKSVPAAILEKSAPAIGEPMTEAEALAKLMDMAKQNKVFRSLIGTGYYDTRNTLAHKEWLKFEGTPGIRAFDLHRIGE